MTFIRYSMIVEDFERNAVKRPESRMQLFTGYFQHSGQVKAIFKAINNLSVNCLQRKILILRSLLFSMQTSESLYGVFSHFRTLNLSSQLSKPQFDKQHSETYRSRFLNRKTYFLIVVMCAAGELEEAEIFCNLDLHMQKSNRKQSDADS